MEAGESSKNPGKDVVTELSKTSFELDAQKYQSSGVEEDSSDVLSSDSAEFADPRKEDFSDFKVVLSRSHRSGFKKWLKVNKPIFGGLIETHVKQPKNQKFINELLPGWFFEDNYGFSDLGKIWVLWHPSVKVVVLAKSLQMITCEVLLPDAHQWIVVSVVYAANEVDTRVHLWEDLKQLSASPIIGNRAWLVLGDFNQTLHPTDHFDPVTLNVDRRTRDFRECLLDAELSDLRYQGSKFTWWNKSKTRPVAKKLDRVLANESWSLCFPSSYDVFGAPDFSDHAVCGVIPSSTGEKIKRPFKFFNFFLQNTDFIQEIGMHWLSLNVTGSAMYRVSKKLKILKKKLEAQRKWSILAKAEESFLCQRSRVTWMREGDGNMAYFHRMVEKKTLQCLCRAIWSSFCPINAHKIRSLIWRNLFQTKRSKQLFSRSLEIRQVAQTAILRNFFVGCWNYIGAEVTEAVAEFFQSGRLLEQGNATSLILIPKITNATQPSDFRPISCLNTVYKVIAKLLATRLQSLLVHVISSSQSAFLLGRLLAENVLLATEIVHVYNKSNIDPSAMLKVDLRKAFDSVRWDFILSVMKAIASPDKFINWIHQCIATPSFSVSVNGASGGFFKSSKGLRQGDPLSPYLFVLAMEVFSKLLQSRFDAGYIHYHPQTSDLSLSHLMFANDIMIFFDGGSSSLHGVVEALDDFTSWSGLKVNRDKSHLFLAGVVQYEKDTMLRYDFPIGTLPIRYLGLPLMHRKLKISEYAPLLDKISARFRSWAVKSLSHAGRVQLISSVINGTVNFWISTFLLPKGCLKRIEASALVSCGLVTSIFAKPPRSRGKVCVCLRMKVVWVLGVSQNGTKPYV
ncbi:PREDICTED: uncharacterized protein LOC104767537 [Camelina sativa]|uniref:Uncharacterized protein LOC104767537 n=1 Tax=Camelina sativa TaxID=90675 RepID=A0ABM0XRJ1_CAMSA|nr:PREDICTED: uncharacterized protein LOC104767537 [Camelina sativa]